MKPEKMIALLGLADLTADDKKYIDLLRNQTDAEIKKFPKNPLVILELLRREAVEEIKAAEAKATGDADRRAAVKRTEKLFAYWVARRVKPVEIVKPYRDAAGRVVFGCEWYAVALKTDISGVDVAEQKHPQGIDFFRFIEDAGKEPGKEEMPLPSISELKAFIKLKNAESRKDKNRFYYDPAPDLPAYNAESMLDILFLLTDEKAGIFPKASYKNIDAAIYLESERGAAMIMPVRKNPNKETA